MSRFFKVLQNLICLNLKVSIITVCLNSEKTILKTIKSVNNQNYAEVEHIFIDGGSIDKTKIIIKENSKRQLKIINQPSQGIYNAMNLGIKNSHGDVIAFLNSDDFYDNDRVIQKIAELFDNNTEIVYGNITYFNTNEGKKNWRSFKPGLYYPLAYSKGWHPPHPAFFIKKNSIKKLFDESLEISADFNFMFYHQEILQLKSKYININCVNMGVGGVSQKFHNIVKGNQNIIKIINKYYKINLIVFLLRRFIFKINSIF